MLISTPPLDGDGSVRSSGSEPRGTTTDLPDGEHGGHDTTLIVPEGTGTVPYDQWREVTDDFETQSVVVDHGCDFESSGVLILEGEEEEPEEEERAIVNMAAVVPALEQNGAVDDMNLSIPSDDSVPTIVGSLEGVGGRNQTTAPAEESRENTGSGTEDSEHTKKSEEGQTASGPSSREWFGSRNFSYIVVVPTVMACVASMTGTFFLFRERNSLLASVASLEQEVFDLKQEAEKRKQEEALNWDSAGSSSGETTLVDNCWLRANVMLGECAYSFKESLEQSYEDNPLTKLYKSGKTVLNGSADEERVMREQAANSDVHSSFLKTMDTFGQTWKNTVTDMSKWPTGMKEATTSLLKFFSSETEASAADISKPSNHTSSEAVDDILHGFAEFLTAASSVSVALGGAMIAATAEKASEALDFNQSMRDLFDAIDKASLAHVVDV